jgi:hypothetical protein
VRRSLSVIGGFFIRTLLWLIPSVGIWFWFGDYFSAPISWLSGQSMTALFPTWVYSYEIEGSIVRLFTIIPPPKSSPELSGNLVIEVSPLAYAFGLPLIAALFLASRARDVWWKLPFSALMLLPFQAWGVCFKWLMVVGIQYGQSSQPLTHFNALHANLIGVGSQMGYLIFPMLVPVMLWLYLERRFVTTVVVDGALAGIVESDRRAT